ncbi:MFS transporter [Amycolatopsis rubida]|uniref:Drug resistance transporter, EmrB/QacA subfamily n=1 Tax=Amycolatopsis rubida TaxID=112413 RepID=A0A1I5Z8J3_9PSEU|nr:MULTISPECIES: MFS transporter [Amycolatopsis]MYW89922.1 DHA2 family efflux MFS transporter permease subunit [Amycolatopsis rubida]NEC54899.1 MFS transporter [Amycolatopsis rubida]OAP25104.1 Multidrug resistance protein stp [Amycolatopsis sp. M39]SFQ52803.1 drug resistance transporter, EmrB/QacA subfamily [Amycolatopsis rubida]
MGAGTARGRFGILAILCSSILVVAMDNTIVNVALPVIRTDLDASINGLQWTIDSYTLVIACFLMLGGATGDRLGRKRTFLAGLVLFGLGSLLCSVAPSIGWLVAARIVQALGGAMLNPVAMSIITNVFADPGERARAIGVWGSIVGISLGVGPVLGGVLTESIGWRAIFWVNVPVVVAALALTARYVPESRAPHPRRPDPVGQVLVVVLLGSAVTAAIEGQRLGWGSPAILGLAGLGGLALLALIRWELRRREPLVELRFFRSAPFSSATISAVCGLAAFGTFLFLSPLYLQDERGLSALQSGLMLLPAAVAVTIAAPLSGRLVATRGARIPLLAAGISMTVVAVLLTTASGATPLWMLAIAYGVFGLGFGLLNPPVTNAAVSGMPRSQAGVAAAVASTSRQVGQTLGVAVAGSILAAAATPLTGYATAWWAVAGGTTVIIALAILATTARARAGAERVARRFADEPLTEPV